MRYEMGITMIIILFTFGSLTRHSLLSGGFSTTIVDGVIRCGYISKHVVCVNCVRTQRRKKTISKLQDANFHTLSIMMQILLLSLHQRHIAQVHYASFPALNEFTR